MPTQFQYRLIVVVPQARYATLFSWWQSNIDANDDGSSWPKLNVSGNEADPEQARWCSIALTDAQLKAVLLRMCTLASVAAPTNPQWNSWSRAQKKSWLVGVRNQFGANTGIWVTLSDNDGDWDDPEAELLARALKRRQAALAG